MAILDVINAVAIDNDSNKHIDLRQALYIIEHEGSLIVKAEDFGHDAYIVFSEGFAPDDVMSSHTRFGFMMICADGYIAYAEDGYNVTQALARFAEQINIELKD